MRITVKDASILGTEAAKLIMEEARNYPFTRLVDIYIELNTDNLDLVQFSARSIACPMNAITKCETPIAVLRTKDGIHIFLTQMLMAVAVIDERNIEKDEPLKPKVHLPKG